MNQNNQQPGSADLDFDLDELQALCDAVKRPWYGTCQIADGVTDEAAVAFIEAFGPDTVSELIAASRLAAGGDDLIAMQRAALDSWNESRNAAVEALHRGDIAAALSALSAQAAPSPQVAEELPPLPKAHQKGWIYTTEQMQQYARDAIAASRRAEQAEQVAECVLQYKKGYQHGYEEGRAEIASLPDVAMPDLSKDQLNHIVRQYFAAASDREAAKDAIDHAFKEVRRLAAQPAEGSAQVATSEQVEFPHSYRKWDLKREDYEAPPFSAPAGQHDADFDGLLGAIMNLPARLKDSDFASSTDRLNYKTGHRDARHDACDLLAEFATRCRAQGGNTSKELRDICANWKSGVISGQEAMFEVSKFAAEGATPAGDAWEPIQTMPVGRFVLCAGEMDGPGDWRMKMGQKDGRTGKITLLGGSWKPTRWTPLPPPPRIDGDKHGEQGGSK